jgi:hypothetical protein
MLLFLGRVSLEKIFVYHFLGFNQEKVYKFMICIYR